MPRSAAQPVAWRLRYAKADRLVSYMNGLVWRYAHRDHYELEKAVVGWRIVRVGAAGRRFGPRPS